MSVLVMRQAVVSCAMTAPPKTSEVMTVVDAISAFMVVFTYVSSQMVRPAVTGCSRSGCTALGRYPNRDSGAPVNK